MIRCFLLLLLLPSIGFSQNYGYFAGTRSASMAHSTVAVSDIWASHHNQAALAFLEKPTFGLSYENRFFLRDLSITNAAFAYPTAIGTLGMSMSYFGFDLYNNSKLGLNYSRKFGKFFSLGLQLNYHLYHVEEGSGSPNTLTFEAGILAKPISSLSLGFHIFNPSRSFKNKETEEYLPVIGQLGFLYQFSENVGLTGEIKKANNTKERYAAGLSYRILKILAFRAGVGIQPLTNTFGLGLYFNGFSADFSYEYAQTLGNNAGIGLQYEF